MTESAKALSLNVRPADHDACVRRPNVSRRRKDTNDREEAQNAFEVPSDCRLRHQSKFHTGHSDFSNQSLGLRTERGCRNGVRVSDVTLSLALAVPSRPCIDEGVFETSLRQAKRAWLIERATSVERSECPLRVECGRVLMSAIGQLQTSPIRSESPDSGLLLIATSVLGSQYFASYPARRRARRS